MNRYVRWLIDRAEAQRWRRFPTHNCALPPGRELAFLFRAQHDEICAAIRSVTPELAWLRSVA